MSGPQFCHLQSFSQRANAAGQHVGQVLKEAARDPEFSAHIDAPLPPRVIYGAAPDEVQRLHDAMVDAGGTSVELADGSTRTRRLRRDRHTLMTFIASHPFPSKFVAEDAEASVLYEGWVERNVAWLRQKFEGRLVGVIEHRDEEHPHIHAFILPSDDPECHARRLNPAWVAKEKAEAEARANDADKRTAVKLGNAAYKTRARELQDEYHAEVGQPCGLTRTGPKGERLSRAQWKARKEAARRDADLMDQMEERIARLATTEAEIEAAANETAGELVRRVDAVEAAERRAAEKLADAERARALANQECRRAEDVARQAEAAGRAERDRLVAEGRAEGEAQAERVRQKEFTKIDQWRKTLRDREAALEEEKRSFTHERERFFVEVVANATAMVVGVFVGILDGSVHRADDGRGWKVDDPDLRKKVMSSQASAGLRKAADTISDLWDRLTARLSQAERDEQIKEAQATAREVRQQAPTSMGFEP